MKIWLRVFIFLLSFQLEVRVKAADVLQVPADCLKTNEACVIKATKEPFHFDEKEFALHATPGSMLEKSGTKNWRFVKGQVWVEKAHNVRIETLYGDISAARGEYWIISADDKIWVRNMSADLNVTLRDGRKLQAPPGFEFWIGGLNSKAQSDYGMIQPIDMQEHLPLWFSLYRGDKKEFIERVTHFHDNWGDLVEKSSELYKGESLRKLASIEDAKKAEIAKKRQAELERERIRELFRSRVFDR